MVDRIDKTTFSEKGYHGLLEAALGNGYSFENFSIKDDERASRVCLLRHDVDADASAALRMAEIEAALAVRSTFFFMLRSPLYNLFSRSSARAVEKILSLGHHLGLHFDASFVPEKCPSPIDSIAIEGECLSRMFQVPVNVFSLHQPSTALLQSGLDVPGWVNAYDFDEYNGFYYISDSNMEWRVDSPFVVFSRQLHSSVHLLIHPMWWVYGNCENRNTNSIWNRAIQSNFAQAQQQLLETERAYGPPRKMTIE